MRRVKQLPKFPIIAAVFVGVSLFGILIGLTFIGRLLDRLTLQPQPDNIIATTIADALVTAIILPSPTPQNTPTPSPATETPALDAAALLANSDAQRVVPSCQNEITVDGRIDEWAAVSDFAIAIRFNTYGPTLWTGIDDASGDVLICWTQQALHLFVAVRDDVHAQTARGRDIFLGDEIELLLDTNLDADANRTLWDGDDTQLILSAGNFANVATEAVQYRPTFIPAIDVTLAVLEGEQRGNYTLEATIPWPQLHLTPDPDQHYRMCISLSDNDQPNRASQDSMVSHCDALRVNNPTTWDTVQFVR